MSDVLIEFLSEAGHAQALGKDAFGLGLLTHGAITLVSDNMTHPQPMVVGQVTVSGVNPVLAFKANRQVNVYGVSSGAGSFTFYFRAQSPAAMGLQYWVFDTAGQAMRDPSLADIEAAIYDEFGVKTFDMTMLFMAVAGVIETPSPPNEIPFGFGGGSLGDYVDMTVPAGRTYAIVQSTPFFLATTYDTGSYGTGQYPPELNIGDGEPPLGMTWRHQTLESYYSTGGYVNASTIRAGITAFEFWQQWNPRDATPHLDMHGQCRHLVIDVTGLPSTPMPNPSAPSVSISAATRSVSVQSATAVTTNTPAVSITISGGAAPYTINWVRQSGSTLVVPNGSTTATSFSTRVVNQTPGTSVSAIYVANITDAVGATRASDPVTFTHTVGAIDKMPDAVTLNGMSPSTTSNILGDTASNAIQITGINAPITLRWERYAAAGSIDAITVVIQKAASASGPWADVGSFNPLVGGYQFADVVAQNGDWFRYLIRGATTNAGRKNYTFNMTVWNLDLNNQIASDRPVNITVDSDDNYYQPDYTPNAVDWGNIGGSTNDASFYLANSEQGFWGINQAITVRATISNVVKSGNIVANSRLDFQRNGAYVHDTSGIGNGYWTEATFTVGQVGRFIAHAGTSSGTGTLSYTVTVTNQSAGGAVLDTFTVNQTVDANNDHNVAQPPTVTLDNYYLDQWEYADQGQTHMVYVGRTNITISGGQAPFQYVWERLGGLSGWSVGSYTTYADFYYSGRTNFSDSANYRLKITDAQNRVAYSDWVSVTAAAGNVQN